ncbi:MAG TPA: beta-N-acetylhexosaminidase [Candidatus Acidoferrales bacterium]|jgi:hexosaminidase|nr:beta-N-acetylhexosaminidase [Candidatus Acidoferrales bacterium]
MISRKPGAVSIIVLAMLCAGYSPAQTTSSQGGSAQTPAKKPAANAGRAKPKKPVHEAPPPAPPRPIQVIPKPTSVKPGAGEFVFSARTAIVASAANQPLAEKLRGYLQPAMGFPLPIVRPSATPVANGITLAIDRNLTQFGPEGYRLEIARTGIRVRASAPAGIFYGIQTLRQLLPADSLRRSRVDGIRWSVPAATIEDTPRFSWRGVHLDVSRHFMPKEFVLKFLDLMALHKLNVFHWHLVDDQGWRVEIKKYPRLALIGGKTDYTTFNPVQPMQAASLPQGGYYTQDDIREVVRYAADCFITVVPEIEMPGHSGAAVAAYPELGNKLEIEEGGGSTSFMGQFDSNYNVDDSTIHVLQDVLMEVMALFPSKFIHIGGDEVDKRPWHANPKAQARMQQLGLKDENELQSWFVRQMDQFLAAHGRRLVGWDEILEGGLAPGATVMSWRGMAGGVAAAKAGHDVVMAPGDFTYLDHYQWVAPRLEPLAIGGFLPIEVIYNFEPVAPELVPAEARHVLGAQAQLWTEFMPQQKEVEYMAWPRLSALAEAVWSPRDARNFADFFDRLKPDIERLKILDVHFRPVALLPAPAAHWQAGDAPAQFTEHEWDVTKSVASPGQYDVAFMLTGGRGHMEIEWAELRENGAVIQRIVRPGSTDSAARSNDYMFGLQNFHAGSTYTVHASIRGVGGNDSAGDIYVIPQ